MSLPLGLDAKSLAVGVLLGVFLVPVVTAKIAARKS